MKTKYYDIVNLDEIRNLRQVHGYNDKQIIAHLGIHKDTFYKYIKRHPDFADALKIDKKKRVAELVQTLFMKAKGFEHEEVTTEVKVVNEKETKSIKKVKRWIHSDTALIFALVN